MTGIERLRGFARRMDELSVWPGGRKLLDIADQIERETGARRDVDTVSAYDLLPEKDREALRWVRERGGIAYVKDAWNVRSNLARQLETEQTKVDRQQRHIEELQRKLAERRDKINVMRAQMAEVRPRLMPEGMEWLVEAWPRYKDGAPVNFDDIVVDAEGFKLKVNSFEFHPNGFTLHGEFDESHWYEDDDRFDYPAPKVLDADGEEIRVGDTVWDTNGHGPFEVTRIVNADRLRVVCDDEENGHLNVYPQSITHRAPVLASDGEPLEAGQTVWHVNTGIEYSVRSVTNGGAHLFKGDKLGGYCRADYLTHERPESWERLEDDATLAPAAYCNDRGLACVCDPDPDAATYVEAMARDLVRRAKALAERDAK